MNKIFCFILLLTVFSLRAEVSPELEAETPRNITVGEVIQLALKNNLDIRISRSTPIQDQYGLNGLYGAYDPGFNFGANYGFNSSFGGVDSQGRPFPASTTEVENYSSGFGGILPSGLSYQLGGTLTKETVNGNHTPVYFSSPGITLRQPILRNLWIDGPRLQISLAKKNLKIDQQGLRLQVMTVINSVKTAYYNLIYARENVKVNLAARDLAAQLADENKKKVQLGALAPLDEKQAESQMATSEAALLTAEESVVTQENALKNLISDNFAEWANVAPVPVETLLAVPETLNLAESLRRGIEKRPEIIQSRLSVEKQNITIKYTRNQLFPEVDLLGGYGQNSTSLGFQSNIDTLERGTFPYYSYGLTVTIPLSNTSARNNHRSAKEQLNQLMLQLKRTERNIVTAIDNDVKLVRDNLRRIRATRAARDYAEAALSAEQKKLEAGKSTSFIVLQLQSTLTSARSAEVRALADYNISVEQLAFDEGSTLEKNHVDVNWK